MPSQVRGQVAMIAGATGLVGRALVAHLCGSARYARVVALTRRPIERAPATLEGRQVDFSRLDDADPGHVDVAFCALGTTIAAAGSQEAFRRVDHDYTLAYARFALRGGARLFLLVSSVGADRRSGNFYLRVKGEVEEAVCALPFESIAILRPGLLLGDRRESRPAEAMARAVAPFFNPLFVGPLAKYRAVHADQVAGAMAVAAEDERTGVSMLEMPEIERLAGR